MVVAQRSAQPSADVREVRRLELPAGVPAPGKSGMGRYMEAPAGQLLCGRADHSARDSPAATGARQPIERVPV
jgi:hypothetical protein